MKLRAARAFLLLTLGLVFPASAQVRYIIVLPKDSLHVNGDTATWFARLRRDGADSVWQKLPGNLWNVRAPAALLKPDSATAFRLDGGFIQPDEIIEPLKTQPAPIGGGTIESGPTNWGIAVIHADTACGLWGNCGQGTKGAIMGTGADGTHPELVVTGGFDFTVGTPIPPGVNTDTVGVCDGHDSHTSSTMAGRNRNAVLGVATRTQLYVLKVFSNYQGGCYGWLSSQMAATQWSIDHHLDVLSISIGNPHWFAYDQLVADAVAAGVVVVAAAGNDGSTMVWPGAAPGAMGVAAYDGSGGIAGFSNAGPEMFVAAPGVGIEGASPGGGTVFKSGTSMATPHVAGVMLIWRGVCPHCSVATLRQIGCESAHDILTPGFDNSSGCGVIDASAGLRWMAARGWPTMVPPPPTVCSISLHTGCGGCGTVTGLDPYLVVPFDAVTGLPIPWITMTYSGRQACWTAAPPPGALGTSPIFALQRQ